MDGLQVADRDRPSSIPWSVRLTEATPIEEERDGGDDQLNQRDRRTSATWKSPIDLAMSDRNRVDEARWLGWAGNDLGLGQDRVSPTRLRCLVLSVTN